MLADPTRRGPIEAPAGHGPSTATRLAEACPVSRQALVKHLQALEEVGAGWDDRLGSLERFPAARRSG